MVKWFEKFVKFAEFEKLLYKLSKTQITTEYDITGGSDSEVPLTHNHSPVTTNLRNSQ